MIIVAWQLWSLIFEPEKYQPPEIEDEQQLSAKSSNESFETCFSNARHAYSEENVFAEGDQIQRVKFKCHWLGSLEDFFDLYPESRVSFESLCVELSQHLFEMENLGITPVLPDGKVGGNAVALLETPELVDDVYLVCSKSGKRANEITQAYSDFTIVKSFNENTWSCCYYSPTTDVIPTSDTPLHYTAMVRGYEKLNWDRKPTYALHGHAFETEMEAFKLNLPISTEATVCSTREDAQALFTLLRKYPFPQHKIFVRKDHGFILLAENGLDANDLIRNRIKPFL